MFTRASYFLLALASILAVPSALGQAAPRVFYVDQSATGADNGTSWADAKTSLQEALLLASAGGEIWVAAGIYTPDVGFQQTKGDREVSFTLSVDVLLFGGFDGTEVRRDERDWERNVTILSGDLLANDGAVFDPTSSTRDDNSRHVVLVSSSISIPAPVIDGFSIVGGHAAAVTTSSGGGVIILSGHVELRNLLFEHNFAQECGGGLGSFRGTFRLYDSRFFQNAAGVRQVSICSAGSGGGIYHDTDLEADPGLPVTHIDNVIFEENSTESCGAALAFSTGPLIVTNSSFLRNRAGYGGAVCGLSLPTRPTSYIANSQFIGNFVTTYGGSALYLEGTSIVVYNSLFNGNSVDLAASRSAGGAIVTDDRAVISLINTTFTNNSAPQAAAVNTLISRTNIANSIFWNNPTQDGPAVDTGNPISSSIQNSISDGGVSFGYVQLGSGVIDANPLFVDAPGEDNLPGTIDDDLRLSMGSPGIDSGDNSLLPQDLFDLDGDGILREPLPVDLDGNIRVRDGGSGTQTVDMGAYEFGAVVDAVERLEGEAVPGQMECGLSVPFPNPMTERSSVEVTTRQSTSVKLSVYDSLGRYIYTVYSGFLNPDTRLVFEINGQVLPSGTYHLQLTGRGGNPLCARTFIVRK